MFGIGMWELVVIVLILVIAVGPKRMPGFIKAVGKAYREFRKATRELRASTGIDDLLEDESIQDLKKIRNDLRKPTAALFDPSPPALTTPNKDKKSASKRKAVHLEGAKSARLEGLSEHELKMELPEQGVDFAELQHRQKLAEAATLEPLPEPAEEPAGESGSQGSKVEHEVPLPETRVEEPVDG